MVYLGSIFHILHWGIAVLAGKLKTINVVKNLLCDREQQEVSGSHDLKLSYAVDLAILGFVVASHSTIEPQAGTLTLLSILSEIHATLDTVTYFEGALLS